MKIPFDVHVYIGENDYWHWGHGPKRPLRWYEVQTLRTGVNGFSKALPRRWFYFKWFSVILDWKWL